MTYLDFDRAREVRPRYQGSSPWALLAAFTKAVARDADTIERCSAIVFDGADVADRLTDVGKIIGFISVGPGALHA